LIGQRYAAPTTVRLSRSEATASPQTIVSEVHCEEIGPSNPDWLVSVPCDVVEPKRHPELMPLSAGSTGLTVPSAIVSVQ
jgi:hypothetical protein